MKKTIILLLALILLSLPVHNSASAYSYGDPNEEKIAEAYKNMQVQLDESPPDFAEAKKIYETVQEEVDMHMGAEPSEAILQNIEDKDKEQLVQNMEKLLAMNISRRLENVDANFKDYDTSKRLLAKGFATYEALSPRIAESDPEMDQQNKDEFNKALKSLGNPGLFGVGKADASQDSFNESKDVILTNLKKEFDIEDFEQGHFTSGEEESTASETTDWTDLANLKNWIPILLLAAVIAAVTVFTIRRRRK
ncbi:hypothetical protein [Metabacillus indicus]|uniref:Extracellular protein n=1 Tax=Metabacillus indicus TaxID=246786 RepID=A0A084GXI3_METID|nr:hypothetical protein [Metabacillus indicus]KEZ52045.1 hypothetical protein GS18_0213210 [Metabacillus indicus]